MAAYAQFVDGSRIIISAALISAVRGVSGCRACLCGAVLLSSGGLNEYVYIASKSFGNKTVNEMSGKVSLMCVNSSSTNIFTR
jgi:hypothetical protein